MSSLDTSNKGAEDPKVSQSSKKRWRWVYWVTGAVILVAALTLLIFLSRGDSEEATQTVIYRPQSDEVHTLTESHLNAATSIYHKEVLRMKLPPNLGTITTLNLLLRAKSDPVGEQSDHPLAHGFLFDILDTTQKSVLGDVDTVTRDSPNVLRLFNLFSREFTTLTADVARILQEDRQVGHLLQPGYTVVIYIVAREPEALSVKLATGHLVHRPR